MSSRNRYLDPTQRHHATALYRALQRVEELAAGGERSVAALEAAMAETRRGHAGGAARLRPRPGRGDARPPRHRRPAGPGGPGRVLRHDPPHRQHPASPLRAGGTMAHPLFGPEVRMMLLEKNAPGMKAFVETLNPITVVDALAGDAFTVEQVWEVLGKAEPRHQAKVFEYFPIEWQVKMAEGAGRPQMARLIELMSHDDRVDLLRRLPPQVSEALLAAGGRRRPPGHRRPVPVRGEHGRVDHDDRLRLAAGRPDGPPGDRAPARPGPGQGDHLLRLHRGRADPEDARHPDAAGPRPGRPEHARSAGSC